MSTPSYTIPLLPLRDVVIFPHMVAPLFVGREKSIRALEEAMKNDKKILLSAQKDAKTNDPGPEDIYSIGTVGSIVQMLRLPDGTVKVLVEGSHRAQMESLESDEKYSKVRVSLIAESNIDSKDAVNLARFIKAKFHDFIKITKKIAPEVLASIDALDDLSRIIDSIAGHLPMEINQKQEILETIDLKDRTEKVLTFIESQLDVVDVEKKIRERVKKYYLQCHI